MTAATVAVPNAPPTATTLAWLGGLLGAIILLAFLPLLHAHAQNLWDRPHYQFFPLALLGAVALAWLYGRKVAPPLTPGGSASTLAGFTVAWALLAVAEVFFSPVLAGIALLMVLAAMIHGVGGTRLLRALLPAWAFLWITIPPPLGLDRRLVLALQSLTSHWSSADLDALGVLHLLDGNVVQISSRRLLVEEACAGVSSLFSVLACTLFLILWLRRPCLRSLLLVVAAVGWVLVCNALRVVTIAVAYDRWALDLSAGLKHDVLGFACFSLAVLLIWSTDCLFLFLMPRAAVPMESILTTPTAVVSMRDILHRAARLLSWPMGVAFGLLFLLHAATYGLSAADGPAELLPAIAGLDAASLPAALAGAQREHFQTEVRATGSVYGEHSKVWMYRLGPRTALVALDYPFPKFHVLNECYVNQGWAIDKSSDRRGEHAEGEPDFFVEVKLHKAAMRSGYLLYCECSQDGTFLEHEFGVLRGAAKRYELALNSWRQRLARPAAEYERLQERGPVYQFQLFVEGNRPLNADERQDAQQLFFQAVNTLRKELYTPS